MLDLLLWMGLGAALGFRRAWRRTRGSYEHATEMISKDAATLGNTAVSRRRLLAKMQGERVAFCLPHTFARSAGGAAVQPLPSPTALADVLDQNGGRRVEMRSTGVAVLLLVVALPLAAQEPASRARSIADNAGTIIGQARFCGVDKERIRQIGERVLSAIERTATSGGADQRSAIELYSTAVIEGSRRQSENTSGQSCAEVLRAFDNVEEMLSSEK